MKLLHRRRPPAQGFGLNDLVFPRKAALARASVEEDESAEQNGAAALAHLGFECALTGNERGFANLRPDAGAAVLSALTISRPVIRGHDFVQNLHPTRLASG